METRRLRLLLELSRLGSMRAVADELGVTTSTVSQQIAALAGEAGTGLIEPAGRRVRLTPAGRRLADHAVTILAAVEAARLDLDPAAEPAGALRVASFATGVRRSLLPVAATLAQRHPKVRLVIHEYEPPEAPALLATDGVDLALSYDYNLAPVRFDRAVAATPLWSADWGLGVPSRPRHRLPGNASVVFGRYRDSDWIVNSRNIADEHAVRTVAALAGFEPRIVHRVDSLDLVQSLILAGFGVGLLPLDRPTGPGLRTVPLTDPPIRLRSYAVVRPGRAGWPPLALVLKLLAVPESRTTQSEPPTKGG